MPRFSAREIITGSARVFWDMVCHAWAFDEMIRKWDAEELANFRVLKPYYIQLGQKFHLDLLPLLLDSPTTCNACSLKTSIVISFSNVDDVQPKCPRCFDDFMVLLRECALAGMAEKDSEISIEDLQAELMRCDS